MFGAVFLNEKMCMKTSRLSLNDNKDFIEESLQLANHDRRGVELVSRTSASLEEKRVWPTVKKTLTEVQNEQKHHKMSP